MAPPAAKDYPMEYLTASAAAAALNYPLWRASAMAQSGFAMHSVTLGPRIALPESVAHFVHAFRPPYRGMIPTVAGMTWARAAIFWTSDTGKDLILRAGGDTATATVVPPLVTGTIVQVINMPLVRATITIQDPSSSFSTARAALWHLYKEHGWRSLWHGTSPAILKTVPKYVTAIAVKDFMQDRLPSASDPQTYYCQDAGNATKVRSAIKSTAAGVAGTVLTNPLDVIRNRMFITHKGLIPTVKEIVAEDGVYTMCTRGMAKNMIAVALPVGCTIFFTDMLLQYRQEQQQQLHH